MGCQLKSAIMKRKDQFLSCELIDICCKARNRTKAISLIGKAWENSSGRLADRIMEICVNSSTSSKVHRKCSAISKCKLFEETVGKDSAVREYTETINDSESISPINSVILGGRCSVKQLHAFTCSSNTKLVEECVRRILQKAYDKNKNYQKMTMNFYLIFHLYRNIYEWSRPSV